VAVAKLWATYVLPASTQT